jgi:hypothetical protein
VPEPQEPADLYRLDPEDFVAARNGLVKRLRATGARAEADLVAKLKRPPATAWALNQVAPERPELIDRVLAAGAGLRAAMEAAVAGDASGLRDAQRIERAAIGGALGAAVGRLGTKANEAARQKMSDTLRAAILDESVAERLRTGTLDADHAAPGFGLDPSTLPARRARQVEPVSPTRAPDKRDRRELERLTQRAERLRDEADRAEVRAREARAAATDAAQRLQAAREKSGQRDG